MYSLTFQLTHCISGTLPVSAYTLYLRVPEIQCVTFQLTHCIYLSAGTLPPFSLHTVYLKGRHCLPPFSLHTVSQDTVCKLKGSAYTLYLCYFPTFQLTHCISGTVPPFSLHTVSLVLCHLSAYTLYLWYSSTFQLTHCISGTLCTLPPFILHYLVLPPFSLHTVYSV